MSETDQGLSREQIHKQIDASLERLQTTTSISTSATADPGHADRGDDGGAHRGLRAGKAREIGFRRVTIEQIQAGWTSLTPRISSPPSRSTT